MWQYSWLLLRRQAGKSLLLSSGFLLAACALILLSATTQTTVAQGNQIISQNWRSSYDLAVLPPQGAPVSKSLVPGDFLEGYNGGISLQQYQQIQLIPGVEVAAPIAFIGYVQMPTPHVLFSQGALEPGYYRLDWTLVAFNGQKEIVERRETTYFYHLNGCNGNAGPISNDLMAALAKKNVVFSCSSSSVPWSEFSTVDSGTFLLAAIDPAAESRLVLLDQHISEGRMLNNADSIHRLDDPQMGRAFACPEGHPQNDISKCKQIPNRAIPVLMNRQLRGQVTLQGSFSRIAPATLDPQTVLTQGGAAYLAHLAPLLVIFHGNVPLVQDDPQRFSTREILWNGHNWEPFIPVYGKFPGFYSLKFLYTPTALTYRPTVSPPGESGPAYVVMPEGTQGSEAAFRQLNPLSIDQASNPYQPKAFYFFDTVGEFKGDALSSQFSNPLNWLPENTYTPVPATLLYDAQGHAVKPTGLLPTTNPAGFQLLPPMALTTLKAAVQLRGDKIISAIRVHVSGVDSANPVSWQRIQKVAGLIEQRTHLRVLVTLGSSPRPTLVYVPGVSQGQFGLTRPIDPVGWVEERWIAIGVSILYLAQLGLTRLLLLGAVLASCLGYLAVSFTAFASAQRGEFAVLSALGWRPGQTARLFLLQAVVLALTGGGLGLLLALLMAFLLNAEPIWLVVIWTLPAIGVLALLSAIYPLRLIWRIRPAEILRAGSTIATSKARLWGLPLWASFSPLWTLVVRNLARARPRTLLTLGSLFLSTVLLLVMFTGILALRQSFTGTLLGNFVLLETAVPQIAGCVFALVLSFLSVTDLLLLQARERQREIGLLAALGWRTGLIERLFVREGVLLAIIGTMPGVLAAEALLAFQHTSQHLVSPVLLALVVVILLLATAGLASLPALRAIRRMQVNDLLRTA